MAFSPFSGFHPPRPSTSSRLHSSGRFQWSNRSFPRQVLRGTPPLPSSLSNSSCPSSTPFPRCQGLDLLAMAALKVAGSSKEEEEKKNNYKESNQSKLVGSVKGDMGIGATGLDPEMKKRRRQTLMPSKYQDSVLQPWKRRTRQSRLPAAAAKLG